MTLAVFTHSSFLPTVSSRQHCQAGSPKHRPSSSSHSDNINVICPFHASPSLVMSPPTKSWNASTKYPKTDSVGRSLIMVDKHSSRKSPNLSRMAAMTRSRLMEWERPISATAAMDANQAIRRATGVDGQRPRPRSTKLRWEWVLSMM